MFTPNPIPAGKPYSSIVNREYNYNQGLTFEELYNQAFQSHRDDVADGRSGKMTPGTSILWDNTTEVQGLIAVAWGELGLDPSGLEAEMLANPGPKEDANRSYAGWGLISGQPADSDLVFKTVIDTSNSTIITRALVVP